MTEQNGLIGLLYCGLVAIASLCKAKWKKKKNLCWVLLFGTNNNDE